MTPTFPQAVAICREVKNRSNAVTVLGGPHVTALQKEILEVQPEIDYVVVGEGELTITELCRMLEHSDREASQIQGLVYRTADGTIQVNPPAGFDQRCRFPAFPGPGFG